MLCQCQFAKALKVKRNLCCFIHITVYGKYGQFFLLLIPDNGTVHIRNRITLAGCISATLNICLQGNTLSVTAGIHKWIENRLKPHFTTIYCHNRCNYINKLCQTGNFYTVRIINQRVQ